jgi:hypothetical protein
VVRGLISSAIRAREVQVADSAEHVQFSSSNAVCTAVSTV